MNEIFWQITEDQTKLQDQTKQHRVRRDQVNSSRFTDYGEGFPVPKLRQWNGKRRSRCRNTWATYSLPQTFLGSSRGNRIPRWHDNWLGNLRNSKVGAVLRWLRRNVFSDLDHLWNYLSFWRVMLQWVRNYDSKIWCWVSVLAEGVWTPASLPVLVDVCAVPEAG